MVDTAVKIAWLGLLDSDDATGSSRAQEHLVHLAQQVVAASGYGWSIALVSCGSEPSQRSISAGVERVVLPAAGSPRTVWDRVSCALPETIADADLVHLHDCFSRSCDLALLIAKQAHKPVCVTEWGIEGHWLSSELSLRELADVIICHNRALAETLHTTRPVDLALCDVDIRQLGVPAPWPSTHCLNASGAPGAYRDGEGERGREGEIPHLSLTPPLPLTARTTIGQGAQYVAAGKRLYDIYRRLIAGTRRVAA